MSLKVGQAQAAGAVAASRAAALNHAGPVGGARQVDGLSASNRSGPEDESLRFSDTWDDLQQNRFKRRAKLGLHADAVRVGNVLASEEIGAMLVSYRSVHEIGFVPSLRFGAMLYERSNAAIGTGGRMRDIGGQLNRVL